MASDQAARVMAMLRARNAATIDALVAAGQFDVVTVP